ncbi:hypothetical protein CsatA_004291 [Cannabis sativa]
MDLEVVGRHALFFDDDANAAFVNSRDALVEWNSLFIDRYDVRHFLSAPPPPRNHRRQVLEPDLDHERYLDLPSPSDEQEQGVSKDEEAVVDSGYRAVAFSYGNFDGAAEQKDTEVESIFHPPFPVPESLIRNLPPSEKVHQIIARTATFVSQHGGQSEIVLRVKQGDNPTFGFLMPDHSLHAYFRFLVDHQELLKSDVDGKQLEEEKKGDTRRDQTGGALSLLGSIYGSGEEEDDTTEDAPEANTNRSNEMVDGVSGSVSHRSEHTESTVNVMVKSDVSNNKSSLKEKVHVIKRNQSINNNVKSRTTSLLKKDGVGLGSICAATSKSQAFAGPSIPKVERPILEPPSDLKRTVDKIVEFILKNGKKFEAILAEQDQPYRRFEFLLPTNQYHPYYLKVLQKNQESGIPGKGCVSEKHGSMAHGMEKRSAKCGEGNANSSGFADNDIPCDYDKEKFRMIIGKSKKDVLDPPPNVNQPQGEVTIDADVTAAILRAATRGIKNPNLELFPKLSWGSIGEDPSDESGQSLSFGSLHTSQPQSSVQKQNAVGQPSVASPVATVRAETAARAAASEADSFEASLTKEEKLKAERLKRAKTFAAMIKSGAAPLKPKPLHSSSFEPPGSGISSSGNEVPISLGKEREGSSVPMDVDALGYIDKSEKKIIVDERNEQRSKRSYRSKSKRHEGDEEESVEEEEEDDKIDHKHSRKKHRSYKSSRHSEDKHRHRKRHSSSKDRESQHSRKCGIDDDRCSRYRRKHNSPSDSGEHRSSRRQHKHHISSDDEHRHTRHRHKCGGSSEDEYEQRTEHGHKNGGSPDNKGRHRSKTTKHRKHRSEREPELEEGEICAKSDQSKANESDRVSRETSIDLLKSYQQESAPSQPSESTEVSDEFRAKIRAMLMATM